ncbi:MAG: T9SS type A sorting domain-containing protein [Bacteroidetes bacterium]|nr:T9SS type A sorting domain-containing protein [Bacteroidota bacterium]
MKKKQINRINFYFIKNTIILFLIFLVVNLSWSQSSSILRKPNYHYVEDNIIKKISDFASNTLDNQLILNVVSPNNTSDATIIYFMNGNSNGVDDFDASVFPEGNPLNTKIYSFINGGKYCINALAAYSAPINISIGFEPKVDGNFTITAGEIQSFNASSSIILEDIKTNSFQDLRVNPIYYFSANTTDAINRFVLHFNFPYIWNVASGNWNTASNWNPVRITPLNTDILVFDGSIQNTPSVILDFPSLQSIGKLKIINNANVLFSSSNTPRTINVVGTSLLPPHLRIDSLSSLTINTVNTISVNVSTGNRGSISGNVTFQNASHKLMATDTSGIIFNNTSVFTAGSGFSGNPFGTTNLSSIIFASGSSYINMVDANPFGATQPNSVVKFQSGSTYKHKSLATPSLNGRVFANFELDAVGFSDNNIIGSAGVNIDNLTITNCTLIGINLTGTTNIKGNIAVSNGELSFSPATSTIINLNGTSPQTIAGSGTLTIASNAHFVVNNTVIIDKSITFGGNLTINANKTLTIISGKLLNVNGNFLIKSDATGTGSLIHSNTLIGTMERYIPIATSDDFHLLASPIASQEINNEFNPQVQSFYTWNETNGSWLAFEDPSFGTINGGNNFLQGKGYAVSYSSTSTKSFTGVLNQGTISTNLTFTPGSYEGWNLLANPYPSAINWNTASGYSRAMLEDAGVGNYAYWIWNPTNGNYGTYISNGFFGTNGVSNFIAPAQGFWVKAISTSFPFSINNYAREHASQNWLKSCTSSSNTIRLNVSSTENNYTDEMIVSFGYNTDLGGAEKMFSLYHDAPSIFSNKLNKNWSINNLTSIINNTIVPVSFKAGKNGIFTISATELNSFTNATYIYLKDLTTNTLSNLNQNPNYTFAANYNDDVHRFQLIFALSSLDVSNKTIKNTNIYSNNKTIYINSNETIKQIAIYNTMGQLIKNVENSTGSIIISMNDNTSGYYIVRVICKNNVYSEKVFIK